MDILMTLNKNYLHQMKIMLFSLQKSHSNTQLTIHVVSMDIQMEDLNHVGIRNMSFKLYRYENKLLNDAKTTSRYPIDIYHRLYAIEYLPKTLDRILYLDPDIVILKSLKSMYETDLGDFYFSGATNISKVLTKFNQLRNHAQDASYYLNTGVLLIHLKKLRESQDLNALTAYIKVNRRYLLLPDQDVLHALYGHKVMLLNHLIYNLSDRAILKHRMSMDKTFVIDKVWVDTHTHIIHYYGKNKPWLKNYKGILKTYYDTFEHDYLESIKQNLKS